MVSTMTSTHIFVGSYDYIYMWQYRTASSRISAFTETTKRFSLFSIVIPIISGSHQPDKENGERERLLH